MTDDGKADYGSVTMTACGQPDPTNHGAPCDQEAAYRVCLCGFHGVLDGPVEVDACADRLAWWREAFPDSVLAAHTIIAEASDDDL